MYTSVLDMKGKLIIPHLNPKKMVIHGRLKALHEKIQKIWVKSRNMKRTKNDNSERRDITGLKLRWVNAAIGMSERDGKW